MLIFQEMKTQGVTADKLQLLSGISGAFRPGVLTALMGVSGAGKTTLMDVLSGRKTGGYIEGEVYISGYPKNQATFARMSGYCEQNDIHSPQITVRESLLFSAFLRLPKEVTDREKKVSSCLYANSISFQLLSISSVFYGCYGTAVVFWGKIGMEIFFLERVK
jgi:ABC-type multidrug transport system ATPase subunit